MNKFQDSVDTNDAFPDEQVLDSSHHLIAWFAYFSNYLANDLVPSDLSFQQ